MTSAIRRSRRLLQLLVGTALAVSLLPARPAHADGTTLAPFTADFTLTRVDGDKADLS